MPAKPANIKTTEAILSYWIELYRDETSMLLLQVPTIARQIAACEPPPNATGQIQQAAAE